MRPLISIIIPLKNEDLRVARCLRSIVEGTYAIKNCEVLVVDGASKDCSREIALQKMIDIPSAYLMSNVTEKVAAGLNSAIRQARGRFVFRMDMHCEYHQNYIASCLIALRRTGVANVGGLLETLPGSGSWASRCIALVTQNPVCVGNSAFRLMKGDQFVDTVPFGAFRREVFDIVGIFREDLDRNQDYEYNARLRKAGFRIYLSSKIRTKYYNSPNVARFLEQARSNGWFAARCWILNPSSLCLRHVAPMLLVIVGTCCIGCSMFSHYATLITAMLSTTYVAMLVYAGIKIGICNNWRHVVLAPILIAMYHFSYGISTVLGIFSGSRLLFKQITTAQ